LLFERYIKQFNSAFPQLSIVKSDRLSYIAYPLSGGFRSWSLIPAAMAGKLLAIEQVLAPILGPPTAFRLFVAIQKTERNSPSWNPLAAGFARGHRLLHISSRADLGRRRGRVE
jgi:hypothetical protein